MAHAVMRGAPSVPGRLQAFAGLRPRRMYMALMGLVSALVIGLAVLLVHQVDAAVHASIVGMSAGGGMNDALHSTAMASQGATPADVAARDATILSASRFAEGIMDYAVFVPKAVAAQMPAAVERQHAAPSIRAAILAYVPRRVPGSNLVEIFDHRISPSPVAMPPAAALQTAVARGRPLQVRSGDLIYSLVPLRWDGHPFGVAANAFLDNGTGQVGFTGLFSTTLRVALATGIVLSAALLLLLCVLIAHWVARPLQRRADTDLLTGLTGQSAFWRHASEWLSRVRQTREPASLLILDLDYFKSINDTFGHYEGDKTLRLVGRALATHRRDGDLFARMGGEEFAVLLRGVRADQAVVFGETLREAVARLHRPDGQPLTVSVGVADATAFGYDARATVHAADLALYEAKERGRNCVCRYRTESGAGVMA